MTAIVQQKYFFIFCDKTPLWRQYISRGERGEFMATNLTHRADRPNLPNGRVDPPGDLDAMSAVELAEALECALDAMTEEDYDEAVIDAYLDALDRKAPMPEIPDTAAAYAGFQQRLRDLQPNGAPLTARASAKPSGRFRHILRAGLIAAAAILLMLGGMITAQAAGIDVFGAFARWTENVFSFGSVRGNGIGDTANEPSQAPIFEQGLEYSSLQEALDDYGITEITAPTWFPQGYTLNELLVTSFEGIDRFTLSANYKNDERLLSIEIMRYTDEPIQQVEKTDTIVESIEINGITFHFIENTDNYTVAWATEHYECHIVGAHNMSIDILREMVGSMFD